MTAIDREVVMPTTLHTAHPATFETARSAAYRLLGDAEDELRAGWAPGTGPTREQAQAAREALRLIAQAKAKLNEAAP